MTITAVVHCDSNGLIGTNRTLAYKSREDHQWFKSYTQGKHLIMGRNTYAECGNLANRGILCLSSSGNLYNGLPTKHTVESLGNSVVICGGAKIYEQYLPNCKQVIVNYTKQVEKRPGSNPTYFNLTQLHELFEFVQFVDYKTFTQVVYRLKKSLITKYTSAIIKANLEPQLLEQSSNGNWADYSKNKCYKPNEVFDTESQALAEIYKNLQKEQSRLEIKLKACKDLQVSILLKSNK